MASWEVLVLIRVVKYPSGAVDALIVDHRSCEHHPEELIDISQWLSAAIPPEWFEIQIQIRLGANSSDDVHLPDTVRYLMIRNASDCKETVQRLRSTGLQDDETKRVRSFHEQMNDELECDLAFCKGNPIT